MRNQGSVQLVCSEALLRGILIAVTICLKQVRRARIEPTYV
jgi:hypothetical protein